MNRGVFLALLLFAATVLTIWAFGLVLAPFLVPIAWAMCLVTVTGGIFRWLARVTGKPGFCAFLMTVVTAGAVVAPLAFVGVVIAKQAGEIARSAQEAPPPAPGGAPGGAPGAAPGSPAAKPAPATPCDDAWDEFFREHPRLDDMRVQVDKFLAPFKTDVKSLKNAALGRVGAPFAAGAMGFLEGALRTLFGFLMMLATLFFLYRDGAKIRAVVLDVAPIPRPEAEKILDTLRATAFAAIVGGIATALIQGTLGGLAFVITGVQAPVLWGFVMAVLSLLPVGGSAFVWAPVCGYFFLTGETDKGWFLLIWGLVIIGSSDNILRPWLTRRAGASDIHPLLLFFATISGIGLFGFSGLVFGPLLIAFLLVVVRIYRGHFGLRALARQARPSG
jgi:predicted PurR-regulated permease PerM